MGLYPRVASLALAAALLSPGCGGGGGGKGDKLVIVASIYPVYDLCRKVAGDVEEVRVLLPPGLSEHGFDPTPEAVKTVADAQLAFLIGLDMDEYLVKTVEAAGGGAKIVRLGEKVIARPYYTPLLGEPDEDAAGSASPTGAPASARPAGKGKAHASAAPAVAGSPALAATAAVSAAAMPAASGAPASAAMGHHGPAGMTGSGGHPGSGSPDPHVWMDVRNAIKLVDAIAAEMAAAAPARKAAFEANAAKAKEQLAKLDDEVRATTATFTHKAFVTFHNSFGYFADAYGLEIVAVIEPYPGKEPSAAYLKQVLSYLHLHPVAALYIEPQLDPKPAEIVAKEAGLPTPLVLDPIGGVSAETDTYEKLIRFNLAALGKSLK